VGECQDGITHFTISSSEDGAVLDGAVRLLHGQGVRIDSIQAMEPTLEDAFLALTSGGEQ
jgi:hypothetical protein